MKQQHLFSMPRIETNPGKFVSVGVVEPGKVQLTGSVDEAASKIRAEEIIKNLDGVESVDNQIRILPADRHA